MHILLLWQYMHDSNRGDANFYTTQILLFLLDPGPPRVNSTYYHGEDPCPGDEIQFECSIIDSQNLTWKSEDYITSDTPLSFLSTSPTNVTEVRSGTYAMLMNKSIDNGRIRLTSTLTITVSESIRESMSHSVTCLNVDVGTNTTVYFQLAGMNFNFHCINMFTQNKKFDPSPHNYKF